jgi:malate dehydrogenase (quinone)
MGDPDVILVGAGVMSATLGVLLKSLEPSLSIELFESLAGPAQESSGAWNNAGTGHAANCELNYTPERADGTIDISKALEVNAEFDLSRQLWAWLVRRRVVLDPRSFLHPAPHVSFVRGGHDVAFLKKRHAALAAHHAFDGMEFSEDRDTLAAWMPLVMEGRDPAESVAATRIESGADVDFGSLTRQILSHLEKQPGFRSHYSTRVTGLERDGARWRVTTKEGSTTARFVFLGAGGGALPLLQRSGVPEARGLAGFPVSGIWLRCDDPALATRHHAKVYGKAPVGAPPMSVPHLDLRVIDGRRSLLFGPYAGFSTRFLKSGSLFDLFRSIRIGNLGPQLAVARDNWPLTRYLIGQVLQSKGRRFAMLRDYFPRARPEDWRLELAGQRVQIIKPDAKRGGILQFGTEIVSSGDHSLVTLLGASPGASTAAWIATRVLETCFGTQMTDREWLPRLREIVPAYGLPLSDHDVLSRRIRAETAEILRIHDHDGSTGQRRVAAV